MLILMKNQITGKELLNEVIGNNKQTQYLKDYVKPLISSKLVKATTGRAEGRRGRKVEYSINMNKFSEIVGDFWNVKFYPERALPSKDFSAEINELKISPELKKTLKEPWGNPIFRKSMSNMYDLTNDSKKLEVLYRMVPELISAKPINIKRILRELDKPLNWYEYFYKILKFPIEFCIYVNWRESEKIIMKRYEQDNKRLTVDARRIIKESSTRGISKDHENLYDKSYKKLTDEQKRYFSWIGRDVYSSQMR
jgi:hypothetical protein